MSAKVNIVLIEGKRADRPSFFSGLTKKGFEVVRVPSGKSALSRMEERVPHVFLVDAASMRTTGRGICRSLRRYAPEIPVILVVKEYSDNLEQIDANEILVQPFTLQKLLNRIIPMLPTDEKDLIQIGSLQLDPDNRWVCYRNRRTRLTPRMVDLLKVLIDHHGEVVERKKLFRKVWDTAYTGDTRTLDVHISWLRQAIEEVPRYPRLIKTIRGVGYRLDIDPESK